MFVFQLCLDILCDLQLCCCVIVPSRKKLALFEALDFELSSVVDNSIFVLRYNSVDLLKWQRVLIDMIPEGITAASWQLGSFTILLLQQQHLLLLVWRQLVESTLDRHQSVDIRKI